jgi:ABC-type lipoprotein release transport system permease subunit
MQDGSAAVIAMLPAGTRAAAYADGDVDSLQARLTGAAGRLVYVAGLSSLEVTLPLLDLVVQQRFVALYLSLVLNICLVVLFALAAMVIYSILTVSVAQRRFEIGVRRILGAGKPSLVALLTIQALLYALPGWALGLGFAALLSGAVNSQLSALGDEGNGAAGGATEVLSGSAVLSATILALAVPLVAALGPIRTALATSIREGLDAASGRGKAGASSGGTEHVIERAGTGRPSGPLLALGLLAFLAGFALYYLLPLALLSLDLGLFLALFLCVFVGMLGGAAMLALNVQGLLQRALACVCLSWWERGPVLRIALSNLGAHARRNRLTSLMYGLAVAFVVFTATVAQQQLQAEAYDTRAETGTMLYASLSGAGQSDQYTTQLRNTASGPSADSGLIAPPPLASTVGQSSYRGSASDASFASPWTTGGAVVAGGELAARMENVLVQQGLKQGQWGWGFVQSDEWGVAANADWAGVHLAPSGPGVVALPWDGAESPAGQSGISSGIDADTGAVAPAASAVGPVAASGESGAEALAPEARPTFAFGRLSNLGRTNAAVLAPQAVSPALFAAYAPEFVVLAGGDAGAPNSRNVTAGAQRLAANRDDAVRMARLAQSARGSARPSALAPTAPQRGSITASGLLYSPWGSSALLGSGGLESSLSTVPGTPAVVSTADSAANQPSARSRVRMGALAIAAPNSRFRRTSAGSSILASVPLALRLAAERGAARPAGLVEPLRLHPYLGPGGGIAMAGGELDRMRDALALAQSAARASALASAQRLGSGSPRGILDWSVADVREEVADLSGALGALDAAFAALTAAAMFLCFFSLVSAMSTNVLEQSREVGVMLALGVRARALVRAYVHEATLLVASASTTGLLIGVAAAWTFGQQRSLFTNQTVPLPVPWTLVIVVVIGSALCGLFAACAPAIRLVKKPVTQLLRSL